MWRIRVEGLDDRVFTTNVLPAAVRKMRELFGASAELRVVLQGSAVDFEITGGHPRTLPAVQQAYTAFFRRLGLARVTVEEQ